MISECATDAGFTEFAWEEWDVGDVAVDDPYKVLGLKPGAGREEIGRVYRTLVRRFPPELNPERFARIHRAYEVLSSFAVAMDEVQKAPDAVLDSLFPAPRVGLRPAEPEPPPFAPRDLETLLRPLRRALLERLLREGLRG
ncbi:MAG: J domain-containing protein [Acidobacteriota bacterium]|nr:J domain-containing protein [Acidobacteriota bacterium]